MTAKKAHEVHLTPTPDADPFRFLERQGHFIPYHDADGTTYYEVPTLIEAEVVTDDYTATLVLRLAPVEGEQPQPTIVSLHFDASGDDGVPNEILRSFKLGTVVREIVEQATTVFREVDQPGVYEIVGANVPEAARQMIRRGRPPQTDKIDRETKKIAAVYRKAVRAGDRAPIQAVEAAFPKMTRRTVQRRVQRAIAQGLITKGGK